VRILCSRFLAAVAFALLLASFGGLSGCDSKPPDGMLEDVEEIDAETRAEIKAQYKERMIAKQSKYLKKGKAGRRNRSD
jgi:hypothetical protein